MNWHIRATRWLSLAGIVLLSACGAGESIAPGTPGSITGKVTAEDGTTPVASAIVYIESKGVASGVTSEVDGDFTINQVEPGTHVVIAEKGNFRSATSVTVQPGKAVNLPAKLKPSGKLGYVRGSFDRIEDILTSLGYAPDELTETTLSTPSALSQYKMIFMNCGSGTSFDVGPALKAWIQAGGTLYASDFELDFVQSMFPEHILAIGSGDEQSVTATITNSALEAFTGKSTASIVYDLGAWRMLESISATPSVLLRGNVTGFDEATFEPRTFNNQPLAISFTHGSGRVVYTTFHNEAGVTADQLAVLRFFIFF
jgi:hypothetical protein